MTDRFSSIVHSFREVLRLPALFGIYIDGVEVTQGIQISTRSGPPDGPSRLWAR